MQVFEAAHISCAGTNSFRFLRSTFWGTSFRCTPKSPAKASARKTAVVPTVRTIAKIAVKSFEQSLSCIIRRDHSRQTRAKIAKGQKMKEITTTATAPLESLMLVSIGAVNAASCILNQRWNISGMRWGCCRSEKNLKTSSGWRWPAVFLREHRFCSSKWNPHSTVQQRVLSLKKQLTAPEDDWKKKISSDAYLYWEGWNDQF